MDRWSVDFEALQKRLTSSRKNLPALVGERPATFVAFDLLQAAGSDTRGLALRDRRELLEELASWWEPPLDLSPGLTRTHTPRRHLRRGTQHEALPASSWGKHVVKG